MATVKFFYVEDDTAVLFGANGTALTASLAAVAGLLSDIKFPIPMFPLWAFFLGLIFAFLSKAIITICNGDMREREKSQSIRDFVMEVRADPATTEEQQQKWMLFGPQWKRVGRSFYRSKQLDLWRNGAQPSTSPPRVSS